MEASQIYRGVDQVVASAGESYCAQVLPVTGSYQSNRPSGASGGSICVPVLDTAAAVTPRR